MRNKWGLSALLLAVFIGTVLSPFASSHPDGLERVAEDKGFIDLATSFFNAPIPDYLFPGIQGEGMGTALAGLAGVIITFIITVGLGKFVTGKKS